MQQGTAVDLENIIDQYPYVQTAHFLILWFYYHTDRSKYEQQYLKSICHVADPEKLWSFLQFKPKPLIEIIAGEERIAAYDSDSANITEAIELPNIEFDFSINTKPESPTNQKKSEDQVVKTKPREEIKTYFDINELADKNFKIENTENDLISKFIIENPRIKPKQINESEVNPEIEDKDRNNGLTDEFVTEAMAKIFEIQGKFEKSIDLYEKLSLKFPEKSNYFATRLKELHDKLNNK